MVETRARTLSDSLFERILGLITRNMPSFDATIPPLITSNQFAEDWLTRFTLQDASRQATLPTDFYPNLEERGYHILTFLIQSYAYLRSLGIRASDNSAMYEDLKTLILNSLRQAMATRTQRHWTSPLAILASYEKPDGTRWVKMDELSESSGRSAVRVWYEELRSRAEVGEAVNIVARWIECDVALLQDDDGDPDQLTVGPGDCAGCELVSKMVSDDTFERKRGEANVERIMWKL